MVRLSTTWLSWLALSWTAAVSPSWAQPSPPSADAFIYAQRAERLERALTEIADRDETTRIVGGASGVALGGFQIGVGIATISELQSNTGLAVFNGAVVALGVLQATFGLIHAFEPTAAEERLTRWRAVRPHLDTFTLLRFEGELAGEAQDTYAIRFSSRYGGAIAIALGAAALTGVGASLTDRDARYAMFRLGGVYLGLAVISALLNSRDTTREDAWTAYVRGVEADQRLKLKDPSAPVLER